MQPIIEEIKQQPADDSRLPKSSSGWPLSQNLPQRCNVPQQSPPDPLLVLGSGAGKLQCPVQAVPLAWHPSRLAAFAPDSTEQPRSTGPTLR